MARQPEELKLRPGECDNTGRNFESGAWKGGRVLTEPRKKICPSGRIQLEAIMQAEWLDEVGRVESEERFKAT